VPSYFQVLDEQVDGGRYLADPGTAGPWSTQLQHGGPPGALLTRSAERLAGADRNDLVALRIAAEFVGPVPVGEVLVEANVVRAARSAVLVDAVLRAGERDCLHARVWLIRVADTTAVAAPLPETQPVPDGLPDLGGRFPYHDTIEWRSLTGHMSTPGPGRTWARPLYTMVPDEPLTGLQRVVVAGDSASGISSELDWATWTFLNIDLDVHLSRPMDGEWVYLDAITSLGTAGAALTRSTVSDVRGAVGCTAQTLVLSPRSA
jgi:hypothetical protein